MPAYGDQKIEEAKGKQKSLNFFDFNSNSFALLFANVVL